VIKDTVTKSLLFVPGLAQEDRESTDMQVGKLVEAIQYLQARIMELELHEMLITPQ